MSSKEGLSPMMRPGSLPMAIFLVCHQLRDEASYYFFNNYLFNIIGYKKHCMAHYMPIYRLMERFAKHGSNVDILDNGLLSSTACVSIHAKGGHVEHLVRARRRGVLRDLKEVQKEAAEMPDIPEEQTEYLYGPFGAKLIKSMVFVLNAVDGISSFGFLAALAGIAITVVIAWIIGTPGLP